MHLRGFELRLFARNVIALRPARFPVDMSDKQCLGLTQAVRKR